MLFSENMSVVDRASNAASSVTSAIVSDVRSSPIERCEEYAESAVEWQVDSSSTISLSSIGDTIQLPSNHSKISNTLFKLLPHRNVPALLQNRYAEDFCSWKKRSIYPDNVSHDQSTSTNNSFEELLTALSKTATTIIGNSTLTRKLENRAKQLGKVFAKMLIPVYDYNETMSDMISRSLDLDDNHQNQQFYSTSFYDSVAIMNQKVCDYIEDIIEFTNISQDHPAFGVFSLLTILDHDILIS